MISTILQWLSAELNRNHPNEAPIVKLSNVPAYSIEGERRVAANQIILSLAGFSAIPASASKTTGFKLGVSNSNDANLKPEIKAVFVADFDDLNYIQGIDRLEEIYQFLQKNEPWEADFGYEKLKVEIKNDAGTRSDLSLMMRGASGKFLPTISCTIKVLA